MSEKEIETLDKGVGIILKQLNEVKELKQQLTAKDKEIAELKADIKTLKLDMVDIAKALDIDTCDDFTVDNILNQIQENTKESTDLQAESARLREALKLALTTINAVKQEQNCSLACEGYESTIKKIKAIRDGEALEGGK